MANETKTMSVRDALAHIIDCLDSGVEQSRAFAEEIKIGREALTSTWGEGDAPVVTVAQLRKHLQRCAASLHHAVAYVTTVAPDGQHNAGIWATAANEALALLHDPPPASPGSTWGEGEPCGCCSTCSCGAIDEDWQKGEEIATGQEAKG